MIRASTQLAPLIEPLRAFGARLPQLSGEELLREEESLLAALRRAIGTDEA